MNKGIYRIAAGVGAAVILVSSATAQAATVTANGTPAPVASDSIAGWPAAPAVQIRERFCMTKEWTNIVILPARQRS